MSPERRPRVLMYHAVGTRTPDIDPDNLFVPVEQFERQLDVLARRRLVPVDLGVFLSGKAPQRAVLLTFDDAYTSTLELAAPRLAARDWPAVVYVASRTVGACSHWNANPEERLLDADGLRQLIGHGFEVGAHSRTHCDLRGLDSADLNDEIAGSADDLEQMLGVRPRSFAFPFGYHDAASRAQVAAAGFDCAFAVHHGRGRFALPRVDINARDNDRVFAAKLHAAWPLLHRTAGLLPPVRRLAHRAVGFASR